MKPTAEIEVRIRAYLDAVAAQLADRPESVRADLLRQLEGHMHEALRGKGGDAPTAADLDAVLADMDPPDSYARSPAAPETDVPDAASPARPAAPAGGSGRWFLLALCFLALNGWAVWRWVGTPATPPGADVSDTVHVEEFSADENAVVSGDTALRWTFSGAMVPPEEVGRPVATAPVSLRPRVKGEFTWTDRRVLQFKPAGKVGWPACNLFEAVVRDDLAAADGRRVDGRRMFTFQTPALKLMEAQQADLNAQREVTLRFVFNAPPDTSGALDKWLTLSTPDVPRLGFRRVGDVVANTLLVRTDPVRHEKLTVAVRKGWPSSSGPLALVDDTTLEIPVKDGLAFQKMIASSPSFEPCRLQAYFTAPVEPAEAARFIEVKPPVKFEVGALESWSGAGVTLTGGFLPGRAYEVTFKTGLRSTGSAALTRDTTGRVAFPNRSPSLAFAGEGRHLSPRGPLNVPVVAVNLRELTVIARPVLPQNLVFYAMREGGDGYYSYNDQHAAQGLVAAPVTKTVPLPERPNEEIKFPVNLREFAGPEPRGAWLISVRGDKGSTEERLVVVSDLGLSVKRASDGVWIWVTSLREARPAAGAEAVVYGRNNQELGRGRADTNGLVFVACDPADETAPPFVITASAAGEVTFLALGSDTESNRDGEDLDGRPYLAGGFEACVFTDRGIYRPGETLHAKALVRDVRLSAPEPFPAVFRVLKPDGRVFKDLPAKLDERGAAECALPFPDYLPTGRYAVQLAMPGTFKVIGETSVGVEDFVPPQIRVALEGLTPRRTAEQPVKFGVRAEHLFGRAASGLPVSGFVSFTPVAFEPAGWTGFAFGDGEREFSPVYRTLEARTLDDDGCAQYTADVSADWRPPAALRVGMSATVTETSGRAATAYGASMLDVYPFYIGLKPARAGGHIRVGEEQRIEVAAVDAAGKVFNPKSPLKMTLERVQWNSVLRRTGSGSYAYQSERTKTMEKDGKVALARGRGTCAITAAHSGDYLLTVADPFGGAATSIRLYAAAADQQWVDWAKDRPDRVELSLDLETYAPGDTAKLAIKAPFAGTALVTVESDRVLDRRVIRFAKNTGTVEIPVTAGYAPNVYCAVSLIRPAVEEAVWTAHRAVGAIALTVTPPGRELAVKVTAPATIRPQTRLTVALDVRDEKGAPAADAEVVVAAVDEGICLLTDFPTPDPLAWFLGQRRLSVDLFDLYSALLPVVADRVDGAASHAGGDSGTLLRRRLSPVRANRFKPVALWRSGLVTGTNGTAEAVFDVPEFSGELRLMAVAFDRTRCGSAHAAVKVKRPLVVQAGLPRFLAPGDTCRLSLGIFNETGADRTVAWKVTCGGPLAAAKPDGAFPMKAGAATTQFVDLQAGAAPGRALCTVEVGAGDEKYTETIELAVRPASAPVTTLRFAALDAKCAVRIEPPAGWMAESLHYELWAAGRPDVKLTGSLDYLLRYPYGCLEQTTSASFPLLYLGDLVARLRPTALGGVDTADYVQAGIWRVLSMQRASGGFALWSHDSELSSWTGIYATHFLVEAKKAGYRVPPDRLDAALAALRDRLDRAPPPAGAEAAANAWADDREERAYACHVLALAGQPEHGWTARLTEEGSTLRYSARVHLASALLAGGRPREARALLGAIALPAGRPERQAGGCLNSQVRETALALAVWAELEPQNELTAQLVQRLEGLQVEGRWYTTQDNAMALFALGKYARNSRPETVPLRAVATFDNGTRMPFDQERGLCWQSKAPGAVKTFHLENEGPGRCYYGVRMEGVPADGTAKEADERGLAVRREWATLEGAILDPRKLKQGDPIVVRLVLTAATEMDNVVVTDLLPAGWEIENPRLAPAESRPWLKDDGSWCAQRDARDDRMLLFTRKLWPGRRFEYCYIVRAVTPGAFVYPAVTAEAMYDAGIRSVHGRGKVEVE